MSLLICLPLWSNWWIAYRQDFFWQESKGTWTKRIPVQTDDWTKYQSPKWHRDKWQVTSDIVTSIDQDMFDKVAVSQVTSWQVTSDIDRSGCVWQSTSLPNDIVPPPVEAPCHPPSWKTAFYLCYIFTFVILIVSRERGVSSVSRISHDQGGTKWPNWRRGFIDSKDPKHTLVCRKTAFVAIYAPFPGQYSHSFLAVQINLQLLNH